MATVSAMLAGSVVLGHRTGVDFSAVDDAASMVPRGAPPRDVADPTLPAEIGRQWVANAGALVRLPDAGLSPLRFQSWLLRSACRPVPLAVLVADGVRKALGARRSAILLQFLLEGLVTTAAGGAIGVVVSWLLVLGLSPRPFLSELLDDRTRTADIAGPDDVKVSTSAMGDAVLKELDRSAS